MTKSIFKTLVAEKMILHFVNVLYLVKPTFKRKLMTSMKNYFIKVLISLIHQYSANKFN